MQEIRVPAGTTLWRPGEKSDYSLFIVKGMADLVYREHKDGPWVQPVGPGYVVGGGESLVNYPRWNELITRDPVVMLKGSREGLLDMMEDDHEVAMRFLSMFAGFLMSMWDRKAEQGITAVGTGPSPSSASP
jgi:CRP-like cAMP-binding protein